MALRRLKAEQKQLTQEIEKGDVVGFKFSPREGSLAWDVEMDGPDETPYSGGLFKIVLDFPPDYPFKAPVVTFLTRIWNPSVSEKGEICLDLLTKWKPVVKVQDILLSLRSLLQDPSPDGAVNNTAAEELKADVKKFRAKAEQWTMDYAHRD